MINTKHSNVIIRDYYLETMKCDSSDIIVYKKKK